jgi:putative FmdB family regulatory protein
MPLYAYECKECGVRFDRRQGFDDPPITVCPECEGVVHRLIQPAGVIFKGSGFYVTDNKGSSLTSTTPKSEKSSAETSKASDSKTSDGKTSESKTEKSKTSAKSDA